MCVDCDPTYELDYPLSDEEYYNPDLNKKMDPEIKRLWIDALLSGEYKQGKGALRFILESLAKKGKRDQSAQRFCCYGVLTDLYHKQTGNGFWSAPSSNEVKFQFVHAMPDLMMPPQEVMDWAKLPSTVILDKADAIKYNGNDQDLGDGTRPSHEFFFAAQNDKGRKFSTIAAVIEKYL